MRICNKLDCTNNIPLKIKIDGRERNLQRRKYCLDCSPFNLHNTKRLDYVRQSGKEIICRRCKRTFTYQRGKGMTTYSCSACDVTTRRQLIKKRAVEHKGSKCMNCGYSKCLSALIFHHLVPEDKSFGIAQAYNKAWSKIEEELDKCVLLCQNCHAEYHEGMLELKDV